MEKPKDHRAPWAFEIRREEMKVLNFGSLNIDNVYSVEHMVAPGETLASSSMQVFCGGKGLNQSIALAKAGVPVYHAGLIGEEGGILLQACEAAGVDTRYIKTVPGKSGHTVIQVDKEGQNCILLYEGANGQVTEAYVDEVLAHFGEGDLLLLQNEINMPEYIIGRAYAAGMEIAINPSPYNSRLDACDFSKISLFLLNEIEGEQITGEKEPEEMFAKLKAAYPSAKVLLTLGQNGSVYQQKEERHRQGICKVKAVDTTAAGDTFTGYFIASMIEGLPVPDGMALAAKASAITVSRSGAAASIPTKEEIMQAVF